MVAAGGVVTVVGAGMAGAACAAALAAAGIPVRVLERDAAPGGRMASPLVHGRRVDLGAAYFTVRDPGFASVVAGWAAAGLARPWTETFSVLAPGRPAGSTTSPLRWAAPLGLSSLVHALLEGVEVRRAVAVPALPAGPVVLAMPDPQAAELVAVPDAVAYRPALVVACGFARRSWPLAAAGFVNDHPDLEFVADDGARRGDGAPVLVAYSTPGLARRYGTDPGGALRAAVAALDELLGTGAPSWTRARLWGSAKPGGRHATTFAVLEREGGGWVGLAGDQWCPEGAPRVESAWRSGTDLAAAVLAARHSPGSAPLADP